MTTTHEIVLLLMNAVEMLVGECKTEKERREMVFIRRSLVITLVVVGSVLSLMVLNTVQRNDALLREVSALRAAWVAWKTNPETFETNQVLQVIRGRSGVVVVDEGFVTSRHKSFETKLSWTNSVLGDGRLSLTKSNVFLWIGEDGTTSMVKVPENAIFPLSYYLRNPVL